MRFSTLSEWLAWQQTLHPLPMELKLARVSAVAERLGLLQDVPITVTVAGTNGKGSVATAVATLLRGLGQKVGLYTSPHLLRYNERIALDGQPVDDAVLCEAFAAVDAARGEQSLTFFEFGTLAAVFLFQRAGVDTQVLEVGLGGRGDAVNVWDADYPVITSIDLDHEAWLGTDRETIGGQKAGILRSGRPLVLGDRNPPDSVLAAAQACQARVSRLGFEYELDVEARCFRWGTNVIPLPIGPAGSLQAGSARADNLATALATLHTMQRGAELTPEILASALLQRPPGRQLNLGGTPECLLDVAHNPQAARELRRWLDSQPERRPLVAILGIMADKAIDAVVEPLLARVDQWITVGLPGPRAAAAGSIEVILQARGATRVQSADTIVQAMALARAAAGEQGRILGFGSFITVQLVLEALSGRDGGRP